MKGQLKLIKYILLYFVIAISASNCREGRISVKSKWSLIKISRPDSIRNIPFVKDTFFVMNITDSGVFNDQAPFRRKQSYANWLKTDSIIRFIGSDTVIHRIRMLTKDTFVIGLDSLNFTFIRMKE